MELAPFDKRLNKWKELPPSLKATYEPMPKPRLKRRNGYWICEHIYVVFGKTPKEAYQGWRMWAIWAHQP